MGIETLALIVAIIYIVALIVGFTAGLLDGKNTKEYKVFKGLISFASQVFIIWLLIAILL